MKCTVQNILCSTSYNVQYNNQDTYTVQYNKQYIYSYKKC